MDHNLIVLLVCLGVAAVVGLLGWVTFRRSPWSDEPERPDPWESLSLGRARENEQPSPTEATPSTPGPTRSLVAQPSNRSLPADQVLAVDLAYRDYMGNETRRIVEVRSVWEKNGFVYFRGWCRLRAGWRTFRADRVVGASIDGMSHPLDARGFAEHLCHRSPSFVRRPANVSAGAKSTIEVSVGSVDVEATDLDQLTAMVFVLVYVARADGRFVAKEKAAVLPLLSAWSAGLGGVPSALVDLSRVHVSLADFGNALDTLSHATEEVRLATTTGAVTIAQASAGVKEDELVVLAAIEDKLFPNG